MHIFKYESTDQKREFGQFLLWDFTDPRLTHPDLAIIEIMETMNAITNDQVIMLVETHGEHLVPNYTAMCGDTTRTRNNATEAIVAVCITIKRFLENQAD